MGSRCRLRQRAASTRRAVESGPPETASISAGWSAKSAKIRSASASVTAPSAADTLLLPVDRLFYVGRCAGVFAVDLAEGRAGEFLLVEGRERLAEPQQRVGGLGAGLEFLRH